MDCKGCPPGAGEKRTGLWVMFFCGLFLDSRVGVKRHEDHKNDLYLNHYYPIFDLNIDQEHGEIVSISEQFIVIY
jgi:hypothetical protein